MKATHSSIQTCKGMCTCRCPHEHTHIHIHPHYIFIGYLMLLTCSCAMVRDEPTCDHQLSGKEMKSWHYWDAISNVEDYQDEPASNQPICLATSHHGWTIHISPDRMPGLFHFGRLPFLQSTNWWVRVLHSRGKLPQSRHVSTTDNHERSEMVSKSIVELEQLHAWKGRPMDGFTLQSTYTQAAGIHFKVWHCILLMGHDGTCTEFKFAPATWCFVDVILLVLLQLHQPCVRSQELRSSQPLRWTRSNKTQPSSNLESCDVHRCP